MRQIFDRLRLLSPHVHFVKGWFQDTFPKATVGAIALLHVDADWYDSVRLCLERFWDDVAPAVSSCSTTMRAGRGARGQWMNSSPHGRWDRCNELALLDTICARARLPADLPRGPW